MSEKSEELVRLLDEWFWGCLEYNHIPTKGVNIVSQGYYTDKIEELYSAESARLREEIAKWQKMCEEFVGCSMLSDEFADEPHEPESFGGYVKNLIGQIDSQSLLIEKLREALKPLAEPNLALRQDLPKFRKDAQEVLAILSQSEKKEGG